MAMVLVAGIGMLAGIAAGLNSVASSGVMPSAGDLWETVAFFSIGGAVFFFLLRWFLIKLAKSLGANGSALRRHEAGNVWPFGIFLLSYFGALGIQFNLITTGLLWLLFLIAQLRWLMRCTGSIAGHRLVLSRSTLAALFMFSGVAALVYQVAWQRLLFTLFGVNIESVTLIVSIFMFGLGVGAMAGGWLSGKYSRKLPELFLWIEFAIAGFGFLSVPLIHFAGSVAAGYNTTGIATAVYLLLFFPTLCMGATLPVLVAYLHRGGSRLGSSVGLLYTFNTAGSALACFLTAGVLFRFLGLTGSVWFAASCNLLTGWLVFLYCRKTAGKDQTSSNNQHVA